MVKFNKRAILIIGNVLIPVICIVILGLLSTGQGDYTEIFEPAGVESLIEPANFTFAIWGPIFLLLIVFVGYQLRALFKGFTNDAKTEYVEQVSVYFILSTIFTSFWYGFWLYRIIWAATIFMVLYLASLIVGYLRLKINLVDRSRMEKIAISVPWSIYSAWVTAATILSITTFLVSVGFNTPPFLLTDAYWAVIILIVALVIYVATLLIRNDYGFATVGIWTLLGILFERFFAPILVLEVIITAIVGIIALSIAIIYQAMRNR
jgi:hypothetical protein